MKEIKLRVFTRAPQRYLKELPFILVIKDKRVFVSEDLSTKMSDKPNVDKKMSTNYDLPTSVKIKNHHACGCMVKESKLCKEHGRF